MRYLIKERIFSFSDRFIIKDENNNPQYEVIGKILSLGNKLDIYNMQGDKLIYIEEKLLRLLPEYTLYKDGNIVARINKEFTLFKPKFKIESQYGKFSIEGNVFQHDFNILKNGKAIAWVNKKWVSLSDTYSVEISDGEDQSFILAMVIVLDQIFYDNKNS